LGYGDAPDFPAPSRHAQLDSTIPNSAQHNHRASYTILQVVPELETGGAEKTAIDVARALVEAGHRSIVASGGGRMVKQLLEEGSTHIQLPLRKRGPISLYRNSRSLSGLIADHQVDLVHARSRGPAWSSLWATRRSATPFVTTYHGAYNQKNWFKAYYNSVMARADLVIANSKWTGRLIAQRNPFAAAKIIPIARGTDFSNFNRDAIDDRRVEALRTAWSLKSQTPVVVNLARLTHWKGQGVLIDAAAEVLKVIPECRFVLAGDAQGRTAYRDGLVEHIQRLGLQDSVALVGHCDDPAAAMKLADVAVVPSVEAEAFGRAAVEACALETPVIVTKIGAVEETIVCPPDVAEEERTGWKVPPNDKHALANALIAALQLPDNKRQLVGENSRRYVTSAFSLQQMTDKTLDVYDRLLQPAE